MEADYAPVKTPQGPSAATPLPRGGEAGAPSSPSNAFVLGIAREEPMVRVGPSRGNGRETTLQFGTDCAPGAPPPQGVCRLIILFRGRRMQQQEFSGGRARAPAGGATPELKAKGAPTTPESQHNSKTDVFLQAEAWLAQNQPSKKAARGPPGKTRLTAPSSRPHLDKLINHISRKREQKRRHNTAHGTGHLKHLTKTPFQMNQLPPKRQGEDQGYTGGQLTQHA